MAGTKATVSDERDEREREQMIERSARARYLLTIADEFRTMNIGRTETEKLTGSLRHVGELRAAVMAYDALGERKR